MKELALAILKSLVAALPELASLLAAGVAARPDHPLADDVRSILPEDSASERVRRELEARG